MTSYTTQTVRAGGFQTAYLDAGDPAKETIVLIHDGGFGTTAELCWGGMIDHLAQDYRVLAPELLGWGGTDKVVYLDRSPYVPRIAHIAAFCEELGISSAHFVGSSFGGSVLLRALTAAGSPWPVAKAVSISGTGGPYRLPEGIAALGNFTPSLEEAERLTSFMVTSTEGMDDHIKQRFENSLIPGHWEALNAPRLSNPSAERQLPPDPFLDDWAKVTTPVLLVEGRHDALLEDGWSGRMALAAVNAESVVVDFAHEPNVEAPEWTAGLIRDYLTGVNR